MVEILHKAPRDRSGRVIGVPPPRLSRRFVKWLSIPQQVEFQEVAHRTLELQKRRKALWEEIGLDPRETYQINPDGSVVNVGRPTPHY